METRFSKKLKIIITIDNCPHQLNGKLKGLGFINYKSDYLQPSSCTYEEMDGTYSIQKKIKLEEGTIEEVLVISNIIAMTLKSEFKTKKYLQDLLGLMNSIDLDKVNNYDGNRVYYFKLLKRQIEGSLDNPACVFTNAIFKEESSF